MPLTGHPNAEVSVYAGALTVVVVWGATAAGLSVPPEVSSAFTTLVTGIVLFGGRGRVGKGRGRH